MTARSIRRSSSATDLELVADAQAGEQWAFGALVDRYRRFVRGRSRGYFLRGGDGDDLEQEALIGFYKSVRDFDPDMAASFRSFADLCINRQLITAIKAANRQKHVPLNHSVSISTTHTDDEDEDRGHAETLISVDPDADPLHQLVAREELAGTHAVLAGVLSPFEVEVLTRYVNGASYESIAAHLGRQVKAVDNALQRIKRKMAAHREAQQSALVAA